MKKLISVLLSCAMIFALIPVISLPIVASSPAKISIEKTSSKPDSTVEIAVSIADNPGIAAAAITFSFDSDLTLIGATKGEVFSALTMTVPNALKNGGSVSDSCRIAWFGNDNVTENGVILTLKFKISPDAVAKKHVISAICSDEGFADETRTSVDVIFEAGEIDVIDYISGDVDGNGIINMFDVLTLCQYYVDADGYGVTIANLNSGDVDANGKINMFDVLTLCQYYVDAEGYGVTLLPGKMTKSHSMQAVEYKAPNCTETGNIAYWYCTDCGKCFSDENGNNEISLSDTVIGAIGHTHSNIWSYDDSYHWHVYICGCTDLGVADKTQHSFNAFGKCECGYIAADNYITEYYWENIEDNEYTLREVSSAYLPVGTVVNAEIKQYDHFSAKNSNVFGTVSEDGLTLKVYYKRDVYTVTFNANGGYSVGTAVQKVKYGGNAVLPEFYRDSDENFNYAVSYYDGTYEDIQNDTTVTVIWQNYKKDELAKATNVEVNEDIVTWNAVENATDYTVSTGDYSFTTKELSCKLSKLKNSSGEVITDYGNISVTVKAINSSNSYKPSVSDNKNYFYVPEATGSDVEELKKWNIGYGYNLLNHEYLKFNNNKSTYTVFNVAKLLTIGNANTNQNNNSTTYDACSFSSVEEYWSKIDAQIAANYSTEASASYDKIKAAANLKVALNLAATTEYKSYLSSKIVFCNFYVNKGIKTVDLKESDENLLRNSLDYNFIRDVTRKSNATALMEDEQLAEYIFDNYGTHAILGVTTGGMITSVYVVATNKEENALMLKESASVDYGAEASASYAGATVSAKTSVGISESVGVDTEVKTEETYATYRVETYGGNVNVNLSNISDALKIDKWTLDNGEMPISVYGNNAYDISYLIGLYDAAFAQYYKEYIDGLANDEYKSLTNQFKRYNSLPMNLITEEDKNTLEINLSSYQYGGLEEVCSPNLFGNILKVYPTYCGQYIDKIKVIGGFDNVSSNRKLLDLTFELDASWGRDVDIEFINCGFESGTVNGSPVDTSKVKSDVEVSIGYDGYNMVKDSSGQYYLYIQNKKYVINPVAGETIDIFSCGFSENDGNDVVYLPKMTKTGYDFGGWIHTADNSVVSDSQGILLTEITNDSIYLKPKWNNHITKVVLNANGANTNGTEKYYDQYEKGAFFDDECNNTTESVTVPTKIGYSFGGYYEITDPNDISTGPDETRDRQIIDSDGNIKVTSINCDCEINEIYLYALWIPNIYKITLNYSDDNNTVWTVYEKYGDGFYADEGCNSKVESVDIPTKTGHTFCGYKYGNTEIINKNGVITSKNTTFNSDIALNAIWEPNEYTVTLNLNGGNYATTGEISIVEKYGVGFYSGSSTITKVTVPIKEGYTFVGYYCDEEQIIDKDGNIIVNTEFTVNGVTATALWQYTVSFNANGGTCGTESLTFDENTPVSGLPTPTKDGYTFINWYFLKNNEEIQISNGGTYSNMTVYAKWVNNGSTIDYYDGNSLLLSIPAELGKSTELSCKKDGYILEGCYSDENCNTKITNVTISENNYSFVDENNVFHYKVYTKWNPINYTVSYNGNKPSDATSSVSNIPSATPIAYDAEGNISLNKPYLIGWNFIGWKDNETGKTYSAGASVKNLTSVNGKTITLYAQWEPNSYTVTYNTNKPSNASGNVSYIPGKSDLVYDKSYNLASAPQMSGWKFVCWKDIESGQTYSASASVKNLTSVNSKTITLYAQWEANTYTVNLNANTSECMTSPSISKSSVSVKFNNATGISVSGGDSYYKLVGWKLSNGLQIADANGNFISNKSGYTDSQGRWCYAGNITLYAMWNKADAYSSYTYLNQSNFKSVMQSSSFNKNGNYLLFSDIDCSGYNWSTISTFTGIFNGQNHTINNMRIELSNDASGNFGFIGYNNGTIKNLNFSGCVIYYIGNNSGVYSVAAGIVSGSNNNLINEINVRNCSIIINNDSYMNNQTIHAGMVVGNNLGTLNICSSSANHMYIDTDNECGSDKSDACSKLTNVSLAGGVCALNWSGGRILSCSSTSNVFEHVRACGVVHKGDNDRCLAVSGGIVAIYTSKNSSFVNNSVNGNDLSKTFVKHYYWSWGKFVATEHYAGGYNAYSGDMIGLQREKD